MPRATSFYTKNGKIHPITNSHRVIVHSRNKENEVEEVIDEATPIGEKTNTEKVLTPRGEVEDAYLDITGFGQPVNFSWTDFWANMGRSQTAVAEHIWGI